MPAVKIKETEYGRLQGLEEALKEHIIGQDQAVHAVAGAIKRARADLSGRHRPASFIFVGPTGVGKTYLAKQIAQSLFGSEESMIRFDMSEYMEKYSVSRLLGSAPGYVGYEEGGQLTEAVRNRPYSVVLFDEIEKAHPDVFNVMLQILDDGRVTDSQGRTVDFRNTVIILTSNIGADRLAKTNTLGFVPEEEVEENDYDRRKTIVHEELKQNFRPEFLNRLDDIVVFHRLSEKSVLQIARLLLGELMNRVEDLGYSLTFTDAIAQKLVKESYQAEFGARPLERHIRTQVEDLLAEKILAKEIDEGGAYELCIRQGKIDIIPVKKKSGRKQSQDDGMQPALVEESRG